MKRDSRLSNRSSFKTTTRLLIFALALPGFAGGAAKAADLSAIVKAPPPLPDLTWQGITIIGNIDYSLQYESSGSPYRGGTYSSAGQIAPMNRQSLWLIAPNQEAQSFVGMKIDRRITSDLSLLGRFEIGFNPTTGELSDTLKSIQRSNGIPLNQQAFSGDGARAGQLFNGEAWLGLGSDTYGTFKVGRNNNLSVDMLGAYDQVSSYAFSLFSFAGAMAGMGSSETARIDQSIKYQKTFGPLRVSAIYGNPDTNVKQFYQGAVGIVYPNFSLDVIAGHADSAVSVSSLSGPANLGSQLLGGRVYDNNMAGVFGKYVVGLDRSDSRGSASSSLTLTGGYVYLDYKNPKDGGYGPGHTTIGNYQLGPGFSTNGSSGGGIVNYAYTGGDRVLNISFVTAKYQYDPSLSFAAGYYRYDQNSFGFGVNSLPGITAPSYSNVSCSSSSFTNCSGLTQTVSLRADYLWTKNLNMYAGVAYSAVSGGSAFGYLSKSTFDPTVGLRYFF